MKHHPVKKIKELIEGFFSLPNPAVSDLEDLVVAINNVIDQVDLTPMQVREINEMIRTVSITYTIGEIETEDESFGSFDYTEWDFTDEESFSIDPLSEVEDFDDFVWEEVNEDADLDQYSDFIIFESEEDLKKFLQDLEDQQADQEDEYEDEDEDEDFNWDDCEEDE